MQIGSHFAEQRFRVASFHQRFLMAMAVQQDATIEVRRFVGWRMALEEFAQEKCLSAQFVGAGVIWEQAVQLVAKDRGAAWFQNDHRHT